MNIKIEVCCGSADDAYAAAAAGADRVELNSALFLGGLTPSVGTVRAAAGAGIEIIAMVRPREGGFCYTPREFDTMLDDAKTLLDAGANGIVFGMLSPDGTVDEARCQKLIEAVGSAQAVFHRAIDVVPDWRDALNTLSKIGVCRVLTSGQAPSVADAAGTIRDMIAYANGRIEILPGGGLRLHNVQEFIQKTGCTQVHVSMRKTCIDNSCSAHPDIHISSAVYLPENSYSATDSEKLNSLVSLVSSPKFGS